MRTIKFRVWEKQENKMINWDELANPVDMYSDTWIINAFNVAEEEGLVFQQYTGLKDVEQFDEPKELYTGDIVRMHQFLFDGDEYENEIIGVLEYDDDLAAVCLTKMQQEDVRRYMGYGTKQDEFEKEKIPVCYFYGLHECSWTYLGNIFENPELLEQPNDN